MNKSRSILVLRLMDGPRPGSLVIPPTAATEKKKQEEGRYVSAGGADNYRRGEVRPTGLSCFRAASTTDVRLRSRSNSLLIVDRRPTETPVVVGAAREFQGQGGGSRRHITYSQAVNRSPEGMVMQMA